MTMSHIKSMLSQSFFIPKPTLTEHNLPDQSGRIIIVTGGYAGVGEILTGFLYHNNATVYIAGRNESKARAAISRLQSRYPNSNGCLVYLRLDLSDLRGIKSTVAEFTSKESRLDVLVNNAGVANMTKKPNSAQDTEIHLATNCTGPFLLTQLLLPTLERTASTSTPGSVRVLWAASIVTQLNAPKNGVQFSSPPASGTPVPQSNAGYDYAQSKAGNFFLSQELARRYPNSGVLSVAFNPGNLKSELQRDMPMLVYAIIYWTLHETKLGGYTELYAGWSEDLKGETEGAYVAPWGRRWPLSALRPDVVGGLRGSADGGSGTAKRFWEWCEEHTKAFG